MRTILITGGSPAHRYVANRLTEGVQLDGIIVDEGRQVRPADKVLRWYRKYTAPQLISRALWAVASRILGDQAAYERAILSVLGSANCEQFAHPRVLRVHGINTPQGIDAVSSFAPDVILVYGTGIVGKQVLSRARKIALNMHTGISPYYRGCDCYFWPLYNRELHMIGATVHECVKEVDGGRIFATTRAQLQPEDDVHRVLARCILAGADLYVTKAREVADRDLHGAVQDLSIGKEYKAHEKGLLAEWKVRRAIRSGLIRRFAADPLSDSASVEAAGTLKSNGPERRTEPETCAPAAVRSEANKP